MTLDRQALLLDMRNRTHITFEHPQHWSIGNVQQGPAKWDVKFLVVANEAGLDKYVRKYTLEKGFADAAQSREDAMNKARTLSSRYRRATPQQQQLLRGLHAPSKFKKTSVAANKARQWRCEASEMQTTLPANMLRPIQLKHNADDIIYTDGSRREIPDAGIVTGAGVHRKLASAPIALKVRCNNSGMLNTITRAELAAIHAALKECRSDCDEIIATDSKCSMDKMAKHLRDPMLTTDDIHHPMLKAITQQIISHAHTAFKTTLMKVKSHIGVDGNEEADALANAAAMLVAEGGQHDRDVSTEHCENFDDKFWPQANTNSGMEDQPCLQNVRNLDDALKAEIHEKLRLGQSNQESVYYKSWSSIQRFSNAKFSNAFWDMPAIKEPMRVDLLKARFGRLWNKKLAFMFKMPYLAGESTARDMKCPGDPDSAGHMIGNCSHKEMKALYIARHDRATRQVIKEIKRDNMAATTS